MTTMTDAVASPASVTRAGARTWWRDLWAAPADRFAFSRGLRRGGLVLVVLTLAAAVGAAPLVRDQVTYLQAWAYLSGVLSIPAIATCAVAARRARPDGEYQLWGWCCLANIAMVATGFAVVLVAGNDTLGLRALSLPAVLVVTGLYMRAHLAVMRRRSGGRSVLLDAVQTAIATTVFVGAAVTLAGDRQLALPNSWWTLPCGVGVVGGIIGTVWATVLYHRTPAGHRRVEGLAVVLAVLTATDAAAQLAQGVSGFTLPAAPLLVLQQLTMGVLLLIPLNASRCTVPGLERLSPQHQVRSSRGLTIFAIAAIPGLLAAALAGGVDRFFDWSLQHFAAQATILAVLLALRDLLALDETKRLYHQVEEAAAERQRLLAALSRSLEDDRHRVVAQLHQQAISSYATFSSLILAASRASPSGVAPLPETSERVQADLSRAAESWRELMLAVRPQDVTPASVERLTVATSAMVMRLAGDGPAAALTTDIADSLHLDWATEALVLRIVQEALASASGPRRLTRIELSLAPAPTGLDLRLAAEGVEREPPGDEPAGGLDAVRSFVALSHGELEVETTSTGVVIAARLGHLGPVPERSPRLRAV